MSRPTEADRRATLLVAGITAAGLLLRLSSFRSSLFGDELSSYYIVTGHSLGRVIHILNGHGVDTNPPLYFAVAWLVERLGASAEALRLASLLSGIAAIPMTYLLGRRTIGPRAGVVAAAVMAFSPYLIFYTTEARAYALLMGLTLASTLALLNALDSGRPGWWGAYALCSCAALYTHYTAWFVLAGQAGWALVTHRTAWRPLLLSNAVAVAGFLPWLPVLRKHLHSPGTKVIGLLQPFNTGAVRLNLSHWALGHPFLPLSEMPGPVAIALIAAGCGLGLAGAAISRASLGRGRNPSSRPSAGALVGVLALSLPVGLILYTLLRTSVWDERNLIASSPGLALALGAAAAGEGRIRLLAGCLVAVGFLIGGVAQLAANNQRPEYAAAAAFIERTGRLGDPVVELPGPTPGPLTELDAALAGAGEWANERRPVIRVGQASRDVAVTARPYAPLPAPSPRAIAREAVSLAHGGRLFVVSFGRPSLAAISQPGRLRPRVAFGPVFGSGVAGFLLSVGFESLPKFVDALPRSLRPTQVRRFHGFLGVSVYVFRRQR